MCNLPELLLIGRCGNGEGLGGQFGPAGASTQKPTVLKEMRG